MKALIRTALILGAAILFAGAAFAHGGSFTGPLGGGSGGIFTPAGGGTPSPGTPAGGATPGGTTNPGGSGNDGGSTGGNGPGGSSGPGGSGATPGTSSPGFTGGATGRRKKANTDANLTWAAWWFFNDDRYLNLKNRIRAEQNATDNADLFVGDSGVDAVTRIPAKQIRAKVNPALQFALKDPYYDTRAAAVIALGKTGFRENDLPFIESVLDDKDKRVRESACLAMGILGNRSAVPTLLDVMENATSARRKLGRGTKDVLTRTRAFAAISIGLIGARDVNLDQAEVVPRLMGMLEEKATHRDLHVAPIVALGLMRAHEAVPALLGYLDEKSNGNVARSHCAIALGKIGDPAAIPQLLLALRDKHSVVAQSAAIALGRLAQSDDVKVVNALQKKSHAGDAALKNFSLMALGEIGGDANRSYLLRTLEKAANANAKTFAAIALGVHLHDHAGDPHHVEVARIVHRKFKKAKSPIERGAYAVALGLMRHTDAADDIHAVLRSSEDPRVREHLCVALGLLDHTAAIKTVREVVEERGDIDLRRSAAIALGLLGDREAMDVLRREMEASAKSLAVLGAVTQGLGFIGDVTAVPTLNGMVKDRKNSPDIVRAFSAVALGLLGDKDPVPFLSRLSAGNNYLARTDALTEILTIL